MKKNFHPTPTAKERLDFFLLHKNKIDPISEKIKEVIRNDQKCLIDKKMLKMSSQNSFKKIGGDINWFDDSKLFALEIVYEYTVDCARKIGGFFEKKYVIKPLYSVRLQYAESYPHYKPSVQLKINGVKIDSVEEVKPNLLRSQAVMMETLACFAKIPESDLFYNDWFLYHRSRIKNDF